MAKGRESKPHIGIFGRRNNGKSSLINVLAGQEVAIVSETAGTTTDPVKKSIELSGIGPVVMVDTAGIDDVGELGQMRIKKTRAVIKQIDLAILVITNNTWGPFEQELAGEFERYDIPWFVLHNKADKKPLDEAARQLISKDKEVDLIDFSTMGKADIAKVLALVRKHMPESAWSQPSMLGGLLSYGDIVLLITPIDIEAPEGRLILPQVQAIRDVLDNDAVAIVLKEREVDIFLKQTGIKPRLAVTDSSIFLKADASIPRDIPLTGFSVLLARYKGDFENYLKGTPRIADLQDGDRVLLLESCTHHVSCDDIGRVKIPRWLSQYTGKKLEYEVVSGLNDLPRAITEYALVIQCGGCVITRRQIISRLRPAVEAGVPVTNYGMAIAYVQGIYQRAIQPFVDGDENADDYL